jgi:hypothetical protein
MLLPAAALAGKHKIQAKTDLSAGETLRLDLARSLDLCAENNCFLWIATNPKEPLYLLDVDGAGAWVAFASQPKPDKDREKEDAAPADPAAAQAAADAAAAAELAANYTGAAAPCARWDSKKDEEAAKQRAEENKGLNKAELAAMPKDESWKEKPLLSWDERREKAWCAALTTMTVEKTRGAVTADGDARALLVPADLLPAETFSVWTNGYWGATLGGVELGSPGKMGAVQVRR